MSRIKKFDIDNHARFITGNVYRRQNIFGRKLISPQTVPNKKGWIHIHYNHKFCQLFIENLIFYREKHGFELVSYVIMPNHYHLLIMPKPNFSVANFRMNFKGYTASQIIKNMQSEWDSKFLNRFRATAPKRRKRDPQYHVFQDDDYDFNVFTYKKLQEKILYIHNNPVKAGLVEFASDYEYSSARNYERDDHSTIEIDRMDYFF